MRSMRWSVLSCVSFFLFLAGCTAILPKKAQEVAASWEILGRAEYPQEQVAFVVAREAAGERRVLVSAHHLVQITRNDDGTFDRAYREEPCVLYLASTTGSDLVLTPKDRRWKLPADHSCDVAQAELTIHVHIDDAAKTLELTVHGERDDPEPASFSLAYAPRIEQQSQLPGIP